MVALQFHKMSERSILVQFENPKIDLTQTLIGFKNALEIEYKQFKKAVTINTGYIEILLLFQNNINFLKEIEIINTVYDTLKPEKISKYKHWEIPIYYDRKSVDFQEILKHTQLSDKEIINLHTSVIYMVAFIGFLPGFPYLNGLPEALFIPRKNTPDKHIAANTVAIAAGQCGIYPVNAPAGWYGLGTVPYTIFDKNKKQPNIFTPTDTIRFNSISISEFNGIVKENPTLKFNDKWGK